jgi:sulfur-carrier protein
VLKTVKVSYFALLREQRGAAHETLETDVGDAAALYRQLQAQYGFTLPVDRLRVAINGEFVPWPAPFQQGDELVYIPPVAGG